MTLYISHLLFCDGSRRYVEKLRDVMDLYCKAMEMMVNVVKSIVSFMGVSEENKKLCFLQMFLYLEVDIKSCINYLGLYLNPNDYTKIDWGWMISKVEKTLYG